MFILCPFQNLEQQFALIYMYSSKFSLLETSFVNAFHKFEQQFTVIHLIMHVQLNLIWRPLKNNDYFLYKQSLF